jgi:hypothetical protein
MFFFSIDDHIPKLNVADSIPVYRSPLLLRCNWKTIRPRVPDASADSTRDALDLGVYVLTRT